MEFVAFKSSCLMLSQPIDLFGFGEPSYVLFNY